jgi:hypothetical protein
MLRSHACAEIQKQEPVGCTEKMARSLDDTTNLDCSVVLYYTRSCGQGTAGDGPKPNDKDATTDGQLNGGQVLVARAVPTDRLIPRPTHVGEDDESVYWSSMDHTITCMHDPPRTDDKVHLLVGWYMELFDNSVVRF